jgi:hypothetical protein
MLARGEIGEIKPDIGEYSACSINFYFRMEPD